MVLLAASVSLRFFRFGGVQKMVLSGITAGFLLFVLQKITDDMSRAELMPPVAAAWIPVVIGGLTGFRRVVVPGGRIVASSRSPLCPGMRSSVRVGATALAALLAFIIGSTLAARARCSAQQVGNLLHFPPRPPPPPKKPAPQSNAPMLVQATEIKYDYTNNTVAAVGNVQIYYGGATIEADQVIYDQKTKRLRAQGNVRLTEPDGKITYGQTIDLSDDYRDGFVDSLRLETPDDTRFAAARADRAKGNYTVLQNGVYTACEPCKDDPKKPPLWQVQAARIIHDEGEKMLYFEDARIEFFGVPLAYVPFMSTPDPTVKRKSGFLFPSLSETSQYGFGIEPKYFWALAPNYDLTLGTLLTTKQGALLEGAMAASSARRLLLDQSRRHFPAGSGLLRQPRRAGQPDREHVPRRHSDRRTVRAERQMGVGLDRPIGDRHPVPVRLSAQAIQRRVRSVPNRRRVRKAFRSFT